MTMKRKGFALVPSMKAVNAGLNCFDFSAATMSSRPAARPGVTAGVGGRGGSRWCGPSHVASGTWMGAARGSERARGWPAWGGTSRSHRAHPLLSLAPWHGRERKRPPRSCVHKERRAVVDARARAAFTGRRAEEARRCSSGGDGGRPHPREGSAS